MVTTNHHAICHIIDMGVKIRAIAEAHQLFPEIHVLCEIVESQKVRAHVGTIVTVIYHTIHTLAAFSSNLYINKLKQRDIQRFICDMLLLYSHGRVHTHAKSVTTSALTIIDN